MTDTTSINQTYFNQIASEYDQKYKDTLGQLEKDIRDNIDFIGLRKGGRVLDYACGTGLLSRSLRDQASQCVGIDLSESMVGAYNAKAQSEGLYPEAMQAHLGNLVTPDQPAESPLSAPSFYNFDLAGIGLGFHHFDDPELSARRLADRLAPGGVLFILDFLPHGEHEAGHLRSHHGVAHHGFSEERIRAMFEAAGAGGDFGFRELEKEMVSHNAHGEGQHLVRKMFIARGTKA